MKKKFTITIDSITAERDYVDDGKEIDMNDFSKLRITGRPSVTDLYISFTVPAIEAEDWCIGRVVTVELS